MFGKINSLGIRGVEGYLVSVEVDISDGLPGFIMVGYLSEEVREAQERVRTALKNSDFHLPPRKVTINLSPAGVRKEGTAFDLAIAAGVLCCMNTGSAAEFAKTAFIGELGLDGSVKPVKGILPRVYAAEKAGLRRCFVPEENVLEGTAVRGIEIVGVSSLRRMSEMMLHPSEIEGKWFDGSLFQAEEGGKQAGDYNEVIGQETAKRASQAAAAGMHNILYIGPAGTGKTMTARRLPTILPPITLEESIEVSKIYSICGMLPQDRPLINVRPFRSPHHSITPQALVGGGRNPRPGELSLAYHGVLFLDELAEFPPQILDLMRQPMEEKKVSISRLNGSVDFPAGTMIAAAMNPCKCGFYPDLSRCTCSETQIRRYLSRVSRPFLDRIDIGVEVPSLPGNVRMGKKSGEGSAEMRQRVAAARKMQEKRFSGERIQFNSQMDGQLIERYCGLSREDESFLDKVCKGYRFSTRGCEKVLKTARTLADLEEKDEIGREHISEAVSFRSFEKKFWSFTF